MWRWTAVRCLVWGCIMADVLHLCCSSHRMILCINLKLSEAKLDNPTQTINKPILLLTPRRLSLQTDSTISYRYLLEPVLRVRNVQETVLVLWWYFCKENHNGGWMLMLIYDLWKIVVLFVKMGSLLLMSSAFLRENLNRLVKLTHIQKKKRMFSVYSADPVFS